MFYNTARLVAGLFFLYAGVMKIFGFAGVVGWITFMGYPMPELLAVIAIVVEIVGGLALLANRYVYAASFVLAGFTLLAGVMFHQFWAVSPEMVTNETNHFLKNIVIATGLLLVGETAKKQNN
jgi:putative oxidoreductase